MIISLKDKHPNYKESITGQARTVNHNNTPYTGDTCTISDGFRSALFYTPHAIACTQIMESFNEFIPSTPNQSRLSYFIHPVCAGTLSRLCKTLPPTVLLTGPGRSKGRRSGRETVSGVGFAACIMIFK